MLAPYQPPRATGASFGSKSIRYVNVGVIYTSAGAPIYLDLQLTNRSTYTPHDSSLNILQGSFAQINLQCNAAVDLRVTTSILAGAQLLD